MTAGGSRHTVGRRAAGDWDVTAGGSWDPMAPHDRRRKVASEPDEWRRAGR